MPISIRPATLSDTPRLKELVRATYERQLADNVAPTPECIEAMIAKAAAHFDEIAHNLFDDADDALFVAESSAADSSELTHVVGMSSVYRVTHAEGEVRYIAVAAQAQGLGIGRALHDAIVQWSDTRFDRLLVNTACERVRASFEELEYHVVLKQAVDTATQQYLYKMVRYLRSFGVVRSLCITGGTHGNERIGSVLVDKWSRQPQALHRSSFSSIKSLISNQLAVDRNVRFIDQDLNRCFTQESLRHAYALDSSASHEMQVSVALDRLLGPKIRAHGESAQCDFIIDMHSTTSNMGIVLITAPNDVFALRVAAAVVARYRDLNIHIMGIDCKRDDLFSLDTISPSGMALEVGPLAHGTLNATLLHQTEMVVHAALDFIHEHNQHIESGHTTQYLPHIMCDTDELPTIEVCQSLSLSLSLSVTLMCGWLINIVVA
jgi:succinylglutamate desuccinylase/ribosomal protein S18 acetylase RimI-like enzyme